MATTTKSINRIGTHNGVFQADDVFAIAALKRLYPDAEVVRTRKEEILSTCDLRVDVGAKYNPETGDLWLNTCTPGVDENKW